MEQVAQEDGAASYWLEAVGLGDITVFRVRDESFKGRGSEGSGMDRVRGCS